MTKGGERSELYYTTLPAQKTAGLLALVLAVAALALLVKWMLDSNTDAAFLGGLDFKRYIFNWHPILMYSGLVMSSLAALLSYRLLPVPKSLSKPLHAALHSLSLCCVVAGLTCVIVGNNWPDYNTGGGNTYYANLTSLHSFLGLGAIVLYLQNYVLGLLHFLTPLSLVPVQMRKAYMPMHVFLGGFSFFAAVFAVETGIMELTAELGCGWEPTSANINPAATYDRIAEGCKYANGVGVLVLFSAFLGAFALTDFSRFFPQDRSMENIKIGLLE